MSIDDFGTGYSSLSYLRTAAGQGDQDRPQLRDGPRSQRGRAGVIDAVVKLAHALGKRVVAEGVETVSSAASWTDSGCDELQGFLFAQADDGRRPAAVGAWTRATTTRTRCRLVAVRASWRRRQPAPRARKCGAGRRSQRH
jgi:EAL domain-containing protein (putative c-di-GMP-specific phosphodiesterase class I)